MAKQGVLAALAASGTEAAPVTCESCKSTNTQRYENAGGLKMYSCTDCGWHHFVPAQAAASPEGEGREAFDAGKFEIEWHKKWAEETKGTKPLRYDAHKAFQQAIYKAGFDAALRQSAAPSGGAAKLEAARKCLELVQWHGDMAEGQIRNYINELAQESKTGAVTETK